MPSSHIFAIDSKWFNVSIIYGAPEFVLFVLDNLKRDLTFGYSVRRSEDISAEINFTDSLLFAALRAVILGISKIRIIN